MRKIEIWTDGAALPTNPGQGGWAYLIKEHGQEINRESAGYSFTTNNRMEIMGVIFALQWILDMDNFEEIRNEAKRQINDSIYLDTWTQFRYLCFMTLREFFNTNPWINQSEVARECEIREDLFRQYVSGVKHPSLKRLDYIEDTLRGMLIEAKDFKLTIE